MFRKTFLYAILATVLSCVCVADVVPSKPPIPTAVETSVSPTQPAPQPAAPDLMPETPSAPSVNYEHAFIKMIATLIGLLVLIFFTIWVLRRLGQGRLGQMNLSKTIKIIERRALSPKSMLYLIEIEGQRVVIAESQLEVRAITTVENLSKENE